MTVADSACAVPVRPHATTTQLTFWPTRLLGTTMLLEPVEKMSAAVAKPTPRA